MYIEIINNRVKEIIKENNLVRTGRLLNNTILNISFNKDTFEYNINIDTVKYAEHLMDGKLIETIIGDQIILDNIELYIKDEIRNIINDDLTKNIKTKI